MLDLEEAQACVLESAWDLGTEPVPLEEASGRILACDVLSDIDMPPFNKSSMDGYACRREDIHGPLTVIDTIPAGTASRCTLGPGQCAKIMTGAPVPTGADCVIMVEHTEPLDEKTIRFTKDDTKNNICALGEDMRKGDRVLEKGTCLLPQHIAVLGQAHPSVSRLPKVGIFATGSELVSPENTPSSAQIRNSNAYQAAAQIGAVGICPTQYGIVEDKSDALNTSIARALNDNDVVISSGGVSMGDYDLIPDAVADLGMTLRFQRVAMQPGKPIAFALSEKKAYFGLSGNPFSSFLQLELFVKPFLRKCQGATYDPPPIQLPLSRTIQRKNTARTAWIPVAIEEDGTVTPIEYHGSAHINALTHADGLIRYPKGVDSIEQGKPVSILLLRAE
jgi:molybdopterin molybdotransferase